MLRSLSMHCLGTCFLVICSAVETSGQVRLSHQFAENVSTRIETSSRIDQTLQIAGMNTESGVDVRAVTKQTTGQRDAEGILRIQEQGESLRIDINAQGNQYSFDSANPDNKGSSPLEAIRDIHKLIAQRKATKVIGKDNRVQTVETDQNALGALPVQLQGLVKSELDPERLKKAANEDYDRLPSEPVSVGDTWVRTQNTSFGAGQVMTLQVEYTYQGTVERDGKPYDRITSKILTVDFALENSPLPLQVKGSELKPATDSAGELLYDRARGRIVRATSKSHISGSIQFAVNDMELPSMLDLKISTTEIELP